VTIKYQGREIVTDFHILPIGGCVLGVDWLQTLDEMTINFKNQNVKVTKEGRTWELAGDSDNDMEVVTARLMDKTLYQAAKGWVIYVCGKEDSTPGSRVALPNSQLNYL